MMAAAASTTTTAAEGPPPPGMDPSAAWIQQNPPGEIVLDAETQEPMLVWYKLPIMIPGRRGGGGEADAAKLESAAGALEPSPPPPPPSEMMVVDWPAVVERVERRTYGPPQQKDMPSVCPVNLRMLRLEGLRFLVATRNSPAHKTLLVARLLGWEGTGADKKFPCRLLLEHVPDGEEGIYASLRKQEGDDDDDDYNDVGPLVDLTDGSYVPASLPRDEADPDTWRAYQRGLEEAVELMGDDGEAPPAPAPRKMPPPPPQAVVTAAATSPLVTTTVGASPTEEPASTMAAAGGQRTGATKRVSIEVPPPPRREPANGSAAALASSRGGRDDRAVGAATTPAVAAKPPPEPSASECGGSAPATEGLKAVAQEETLSEPGGGGKHDEHVDFSVPDDDDDTDNKEGTAGDDSEGRGGDSSGQAKGGGGPPEAVEEEEEVYVPKVYGPPILPHDTWEQAWRKLEFSCWNRRVRTNWHDDGSKTYSYVYTKADRCSTGPDAVLDRDYFEELDKVKDFARKHYGWIGPQPAAAGAAAETAAAAAPKETKTTAATTTKTKAVTTAATSTATPTDAATRPQDPAAPRLDDAGNSSSYLARPAELSSPSDESSASITSADRYTFKAAWERLRRKGWVAKRAKDRLANWEYHPPPGTMPEGFHLKENDAVVEYVRKRDAQKRKAKPKAAFAEWPSAEDNKQEAKRRKVGPKKSAFSEKLERAAAVADTEVPSRPKSNVAKLAAHAKKTTAVGNSGTSQPKKRDASSVPLKPSRVVAKKPKTRTKWWKSKPVPSDDEVWPTLLKLGFYVEGGDADTKLYYLPKSLYEKFPRDDVVHFESLQQLRLFLACYGTMPSSAVRIKKSEQEALDRWIAFANVPVTHANSIAVLNDDRVVSNPDLKQLKMLLFAHRFLSVDGTLYLPDSDTYERTVEKRRFGVHKFDENQHVEGYLRPYLRRAWAIVYSSRGSSQRGRRDDSKDPDSRASANVTKLESEDYYSTLSLRLWAATSSHDLPVFSEWPPTEELDEFFDYEAPEHLSEPPTPQKPETSSSVDSRLTSDDTMVEDDELVESEGNEAAQSSESGFQSLWDCIWQVLESTLGFHTAPNGEGYTHARFPGELVLPTPNELAKYLCKHGIPDFNEKKKDISRTVRKMLRDWVASAYVPPDAVDLPVPSESKCLAILSKLGWQRCDDKHYAPGADDNRTHRIEGKDFFKGSDNLRLYLRSAEQLEVLDESKQEGGKSRGKVTQEDLASIRLWASTVELPLPTFGQTDEAPGNRGRSIRSTRRKAFDLTDSVEEVVPKRRSKPSKGSTGSNQDVPGEREMPSVESERSKAPGKSRRSPISKGAVFANTRPAKARMGSSNLPTDSRVHSVEPFSPPTQKAPSMREAAASTPRGSDKAKDSHAANQGSSPHADPVQRTHEADSEDESVTANLFGSALLPLTQRHQESDDEASDDEAGQVQVDLPTPDEIQMHDAGSGNDRSRDHRGEEFDDEKFGIEPGVDMPPCSPRRLDHFHFSTQREPDSDGDSEDGDDVAGFFSPPEA
jgi:hypothetical protein